MSAVTGAPERPATDEPPSASGPFGGSPIRAAATVALAATLVAIAFLTAGGVDETVATPGNTWTEITLTLLGVVAIAAGALARPPGARRHGWVVAGLMAVMFALEAASIAWSVAPDSSWLASGQMLAYLAVFTGAIVLARPLASGWANLLGALVLWAVALCGWSLLVKVFPAALAPANQVGRLQAPFGYWNAIALSAAMGVPCCLWLAARRDGGRRLAALAAPALALLIAVLVLSSSRSADLAAVVAAAVWLAVVPLRLRAVALLVVGAIGGGVISAWALTHHALSHNDIRIAAQDHAGHTFGLIILGVLVVTAIAGVALADTMDRARLSARTRARLGAALLGAVGLGVVLAIGAVAASSRGLTGEISHGWQQLTSPKASVSASSASRVLQFGSSRPLYWHEALDVGDHNLLKGVGEIGFSVAHLRWTTDPTEVMQAHSYVFETYADLGVLGLAVTAALLLAWLVATGRAIGPDRRWSSLDPAQRAERAGLVTLAALVVGFGVQSTLDWTWYFTGLAVPVLIAAGWLAGRGPALDASLEPSATGSGLRRPAPLDRPGVLAVALALCAAALLGGWMVWRPLHSANLTNAAENTGSLADARAAQSADPLTLEPYQVLSALYLDAHRPALARAELERATRVQPQNPLAWSMLADFLVAHHDWQASIPALHNVQVYDTTTDALAVHNGREIGTALPHVTGH